MSWLDNGTIRLGVDLALGGAITWLSKSGDSENVINSYDWGRQVQMSYYSGPIPFTVGEKRPAKFWQHLGWNPIQVGDDFGHQSVILEQRNDGKTIYVKCTPMQWPLENVPGECVFESWLELEGAAVRARARLTNARADHTFYDARTQELPAVYSNGAYRRVMSYTGDRPFTHAPLSEIPPKGPVEGWTHWSATERWSALVNEQGWGVGVWNPDCIRYGGGVNEAKGGQGPKDDACGYMSPTRLEILDHNIVHDYRYDLVLGTLEEIRAHAYRHHRKSDPAWLFENSRQGWTYHNATDGGWPIQGELNVRFKAADPYLLSGPFFCRAEDAGVLVLDAAFESLQPTAQVFWSTSDSADFSQERSLRFPIQGDGRFREYRVELGKSAAYRGGIIQLRIDPSDGPKGTFRLRSARLIKE